ncbi:hypothetical protein [Ramlibacter sp. WS9]|uniref:hypothetical protein n=1 Tax=Ramlibacter sp. WS9 TaxID=1882741 RepID=UPI001E3398CC|nr:hypothetical protein [Ramlibacter sp. WS9]
MSLTANGTASDQLAISNDGVGAGQIGVSGANVTFAGVTFGTFTGGTNGTDLVITFDADATLAAVQALTRAITFANTSQNPSALPRTVTYTVVDGDGGTDTGSTTATVNITNVNDAPDIDTAAAVLGYTENGVAAVIAGATTVTDIDSTDFGGGSLTVGFTANGTAADQLAVRNEGVAAGQIGVSGSNVTYGGVNIGTIDGTFNGVNGVNLVISLNASASPAAVQALSRNITFANTSDNPSTAARTVTFTVNDGDGGTNVDSATATVNVTAANDAPVATVSGGTASYIEDGAAALIDANLAVSDVDDTNLNSATVRISGGFEAGDVLNFVNTANITGSYNAGTSTLTLTGVDTVANYEAALRTITFSGTSQSPTLTKTVEWVVNDGDVNSLAVTRNISVTGVNDAPQLTGSSAVGYTEGAAPTVLIGGIAVADIDNANIAGATVTISGGFVTGQDVLTFTNSGGITGSYNAATGVLTTSGTATKAQYQTFLQSVGYQNTSDNPNTAQRTVSFEVNDGGVSNNLSNTVTSTVDITAVNDKPTIGGAANVASYTENNPAVLIDSALTLADAESNSITGATVTIAAPNFTTGQDVLAFTDSGADNITGSYNAVTGILTFSGTDTLANYEAALESVTYQNTSENPVTAARTISYSITDNGTPTPESSVAVTGTVNVTAVNDAPVNTMSPTQMLAFSNTATPITGLSISDVDAGSATNLTTTLAANDGALLTVGNGASGGTAGIVGGATITTNGTGTVVLTGSVAQINATLAGTNVSYKSADGFTTPVTPSTVTMTTNDAGNTGQDPGLSGTGTTEADIDVLQVGVLPQVWFIDSTPPGSPSGPVGSQNNPFTSVGDFNTAAALAGGPGPNDYIYVQSGTYTGAGINLEPGQTLLGADQPLSFANPFGGAPIVVEAGGGARPTIDVNVASDSGIALASGNTISGINVTTAVASAFGIADSNGTVGALAISNMNITGLGQAVDIDEGGALNVSLGTVSSSASVVNGIQLGGAATALTGTFTATGGAIAGSSGAAFVVGDGLGGANTGGTAAISYGGTISAAGAVNVVSIQDRAAGANSVTLSGVLTHTGSGTAILVDDNAAGAITFSGASSTLNSGSLSAVSLTDNTGATINFTGGGLDIDTTSGTGIVATGGGTINVTGASNSVTSTTGAVVNMDGVSVGGSGITFSSLTATGTVAADAISFNNVDGAGTFSGGTVGVLGTSGASSDGLAITGGSAATFTFGTTTIDDTGADAINLNGANGAVTFSSVNLDGMLGNGISITGNTNAVSVNGGSIGVSNDATLNSVDISGGNGTITIAASSTKAAGNDLLEITGRTGGTVTISGTQSGTVSGIDINSNTGGTINITGQVALVAGTATGVNLANNTGATVNFNAGGNGLDITTTSGAGFTATGGGTVSVQGSGNTIASGSGTALNVVSTTIGASDLNFVSIASSGAVNGIVLNATGSSGGLTVSGNGGANSGGTIQNSTGSAIIATNTQDLNLTQVNISNPAEHGILATDLRGTSSLTNVTIDGFGVGNNEDGLHFVNNGVSAVSTMTITDSTFSNGIDGNDGILMEAQGTSNMTLTVTGSTFTGMFGDALDIQGITGATGAVRLTVSNSDFLSAVASGNGGVQMDPFGDVNFFADIDGNTFNGILNNVVTLGAVGITSGSTADADITIRNNDFDTIIGGQGITAFVDGGHTELLIDNNTIDGLGSTSKAAISVFSNVNGAFTGNVDVTIQNNDIGQAGALWTSGNGSNQAVFLAASFGGSMDALVTNNVIDANATLEVVRARASGTGTLNATFTNNDITDTFTTHMELNGAAGTIGADPGGNLNLSFSGNIVAGGATGTIGITEAGSSTVTVQQASSGAVTTANNSATVNVSGAPTFGGAAPTTPTLPSLPLLALQGEVESSGAGTLASADLQVMAEAAIARWVAAGIGDDQLALLQSVTFGVADLKGSVLGVAAGNVVVVDSNAAGWGWFVDATPMGDEEYGVYSGIFPAAADQMDLLTVLTHELGHVLGIDDHYAGSADVMHGYLDIGQRHAPEASVEVVGVPQMEAGWGGA